ncbi:MAG: MBL fold metallo-hydrolase [Chloroflexi bacterium]|nr:MBL fold metallo-hydrolase [Chloroflexota bacterium]
MRVQLLGTGSPRPRLDRAGTALIVDTGGETFLVDCGPGTTWRLLQANVSSLSIDRVFFTHHHFDHCADFGHFVLTRWDQGAGKVSPLEIYGPPGTVELTERLFGPNGVYDPDITARTQHPMSQQIYARRGGELPRQPPVLRPKNVPHGLVYEGKDWRITAGPASHAQPYLECYSYRIDGPDRSVVFTGDTGRCEGLAEFARGADTLIHMCSFLDDELVKWRLEDSCGGPTMAAQVATQAGARKLVLTHLQSGNMEGADSQAEVIARAREHFAGEVVFAADLLVV